MASKRKMLMGPKGYEMYVNVPAIDPDFSSVGYSRTALHRNGGITVQSSVASHKQFEMTWNKASREDIETIKAMADGVWGDEPIQWLDPTSMDRNVANQAWAQPSIAAYDGVPIFQDQDPTLVPNAVDRNTRYPRDMALYRAAGVSESFYVPVPEGHTAWVGVHGSATGDAGIRVRPMSGLNYLTAVTCPMMAMNIPDLVNTPFNAGDGVTGIELSAIITGLLRNFSVNPSAETDVATYDMTLASGGGIVTRTAGGYAGGYCARLTFDSAAGSGSGLYQQSPVTAGITYSFGLYYRTSKITRVRTFYSWIDSAGQIIASGSGATSVTTAAPAWGSASRAIVEGIVAPSNAVAIRMGIQSITGTSYSGWLLNDFLEIDAVQLNRGDSVQTYRDGNMAGWYWLGAANNSHSAQVPDNITLGAIVIQVLPTGMTPKPGAFPPGRGHSGCRFADKPTLTPHSVPLNLEALSAVLYEVETWE